jgi:major type 1 subunit fimbrin (pilin)
MNKMLLVVALALPVAGFSASQNTINFKGEVSDQTCSVTVNNNATSPAVLLPTVSSTALDTAAKTAGLTNFTIGVTGCASPVSDLNIGTVFVANNLTAGNRIGNTGTATNVSLEIVDPAAPATALDVTGTTPAPGLKLKTGETSASHDFAVAYYAEGQATAGSVIGSVQYAVSYQ